MRALVTGGGGFLGRYIVEQLLERGDEVRSLARGDYPELAALGVDVVRGDLRDSRDVCEACDDVDVVFHTAAVAGVGVHWDDFFHTNLLGARHVVAGCRERGVRRLVFTSSPSVVFAGRDQCGVDEQTPYGLTWLQRYRCHYSRSKALAEQLVLAANGDSLATCALRPHLIWGPRDNHLIPRLLERARQGRLRRVGSGENRVDVTYVENAAAAHLQAADALEQARGGDRTAPAGRAYFLSQGDPVNCWQWIDQVLDLAGLPAVKKSISAAAAWQAGRACESTYRLLGLKREPPMTRFVAAQLSTSHWFNIEAARRDLGYKPAVPTDEGLQRLATWITGR